MIDKFKDSGDWLIKELDSNRHNGTLTLNEMANELVIHYSGDYPILRQINNVSGRNVSHISGRCGNKIYHLFNCFLNDQGDADSSAGILKFSVSEAIQTQVRLPVDYGYDPNEKYPQEKEYIIKDYDDKFIDKIYLRLEQLTRWIPTNSFKILRHDKPFIFALKDHEESVSKFFFNEIEINIINCFKRTLDAGKGINIERCCYSLIVFPEKVNLKTARKTIYKLIYFFSLLTKKYILPSETTLVQIHNGDTYKYKYTSHASIDDSKRHDLTDAMHLINFNNLQHHIQRVSGLYCSNFENLSGSFSALYDSTDEISIDIRNAIFKILSYLESSETNCYKYNAKPNCILTIKKVFEDIRALIKGTDLEEEEREFDKSELQKNLFSRVAFFTAASLRDRLRLILIVVKSYNFLQHIQTTLGLDEEKFLSRIIKIRNDIAHANVDILEVYSTNELSILYFTCLDILHAFLLDLIGISNKDTPEMVKNRL